jgi:hypothetical protein
MARKIKRLKTKGERAQRALDNIKAQRGLDREAFFAEGGEMVRWRGLHLVQRDRKKQANKNLCRQKVMV